MRRWFFLPTGIICFALALAACDAGQVAAPTSPDVKAAEQYLIDGTVTVKEVVAPEPGWLVLRLDDGHHAPRLDGVLGTALLRQGVNKNVRIEVHWVVEGVVRLWAVLHRDTGTPGRFEYEGAGTPDGPVEVEGRTVMTAFSAFEGGAVRESRILVEDQFIADHTVYVDEVYASEPGWLVIHRDNGDNRPRVPGIIAIVPVEEGLNLDVAMPLYAEEVVACGEQIWPMLHVRNVSDDQPYKLDRPIITVPVVNTCQ